MHYLQLRSLLILFCIIGDLDNYDYDKLFNNYFF